MRILSLTLVAAALCCSFTPPSHGHRKGPLAILGYYAGRGTQADSFHVGELTHIIFSFCHLRGDSLSVNNAYDSTRIRQLVALKQDHPDLKVILSMGGWGGCRSCSDEFSTAEGRKVFAKTVKHTLEYFGADGIDLDWEYPALANVPGYPYAPKDRDDFTDLIRRLRKTLGRKYEISFAAGGFTSYIDTCIDWKAVAPKVNFINLMTYDLVNGYDTVTGNHTPLYSTPGQLESTDHALHLLDSFGVPRKKVAIGLAFYARVWANVDSVDNGMRQHGRFFRGVSYKYFGTVLSPDSGYVYHWDTTAEAPYAYNGRLKRFATFDDTASVRLKTEYALSHGLGGVMFWQLTEDTTSHGLLDAIWAAKQEAR